MAHQHPHNLTPGTAVYKEEPTPVAGDPHHPHHPQQGSVPQHLQHPRPSSIVHPQRHPNSPHPPSQPQHSAAFPSPHSTNHGLPLQHQSPYAPPGPNGQPPPEVAYYAHQSPYGTSASGPYPSSEAPDLMAAAHMQRPYPSVYHTPQSNSPASVASSQSHDQHGRFYGQPPSQLPQGIYGYPQYPPMSQVHPSAYPQHPGQQQQQQQQQQQSQQQPQPQPQHQQPPHPNMNSQPLLPSHQPGQAAMQHQQSQSQPTGMTHSPRPKIEPPGMQRPLDPAALQRPPPGPMSSSLNTPTGPQSNGNALHNGPPSGGGVNPNAAPGPIPATTPLVVRQDNNGVQWIAFEYSRDRVKMEYTIRCDVESVNVEQLAADFKTENCVYPRACCSKDLYRGNRLVYETECNTVGWALAELNPCLRGKRGLIQRAVDSWRNSNQDPRLRSRRVRRMAKINNRKQVAASQPNHLAGPSGGGGPAGVPPTVNPMAAPNQRPPPNNIGMGGPQLHHHHAHPDGSTAGSADDVSANGDYDGQRRSVSKSQSTHSPSDIRQSQVFHGYSNYPSAPSVGAAIPPPLHDGMDTLNGHPGSNHTAVAASLTKTEDEERKHSLFGDLPEAKRRKFIVVEDPERNTRVRVRVMLDQVDMDELPDSFRKTNSVYPRSYFPIQMQSPTRSPRGDRFFDDDNPDGGSLDDDQATLGRTIVPVPLMDEAQGDFAVPKLSRAKRGKEVSLNDLGYRMNWSQSRVFYGRRMFLQRALDAYRNKMRTTAPNGHDASLAARHLETRVGKRKWQERRKRSKHHPTTP